jgi:hypothetical protein
MEPIEGVLRKQGAPDIYVHIRQDTPEAFFVTLGQVDRPNVARDRPGASDASLHPGEL